MSESKWFEETAERFIILDEKEEEDSYEWVTKVCSVDEQFMYGLYELC